MVCKKEIRTLFIGIEGQSMHAKPEFSAQWKNSNCRQAAANYVVEVKKLLSA